ncbi:MAG TPA: nitroreductase [Cyanobacteria bacterium UBA12227]|nr:nitroreductase [Cyanobacteria bacterium UBA12227]HAX89452.1 nitroreductase [Cyanobacteria bacterium UBA11370]HBY81166.1 nitroreductase [Cyanobacteria bacterium UBA11148]
MLEKFIKSILPASGVEQLKKLVEGITNSTLRVAVSSRLLSSLYYILLSKDFSRENQAVIYGKLKYIEDLQSNLESQYLLRRNIHRLEKGIIMKPRRDIFALDYIEETVKCYEKSVLEKGKDISESTELQWAHDVLEQYFNVAGSNSVIEEAKRKFLALDKPSKNEIQRVPYKRNTDERSPVNYDDLLKLAYRRRSVRWYLQKPVPRELIDKAVAVATLSPSACNRQPFEFHIFDDPDVVKRVASIPMGTKGFSHNFPVIVVVVGKLRAYFSERDRHVIYIDGSLASMSFMYALETLGLSSCPINWPDIEDRERVMAATLGLEPDERVVMLISVGYADPEGMIPYSQKKELDLLRRYH